jgi:transcriptional regulator with XRE-family HTH domain
MSALGSNVKRAREGFGWTQDELARHAGLAQQVIAEIESGDVKAVSVDKLDDLARGLQMEAWQLLEPDLDVSDVELERLIRLQADRMVTAPTKHEQREACEELKRLHGLRSAAQVRRMEQGFLP